LIRKAGALAGNNYPVHGLDLVAGELLCQYNGALHFRHGPLLFDLDKCLILWPRCHRRTVWND
jgi:hypothetical protein